MIVNDKIIPNKIFLGLSFWYLIIWYFVFAKQQTKYINEKFGTDYIRKSWIKPIGVAIICIISYILIHISISHKFSSEYQGELALNDISGTWISAENELVILKFNENEKTIIVENSIIKVDEYVYLSAKLKKFDMENKTITIIIDNDPSIIWSFQKISNKNDLPILNVTLHSGIRKQLSLLRKSY